MPTGVCGSDLGLWGFQRWRAAEWHWPRDPSNRTQPRAGRTFRLRAHERPSQPFLAQEIDVGLTYLHSANSPADNRRGTIAQPSFIQPRSAGIGGSYRLIAYSASTNR